MRSILAAGLVAGLALASPVLAQDGHRRRTPAKAYDATTVVATVDGNAHHPRQRDRHARPAAGAVPEPAGRRADDRGSWTSWWTSSSSPTALSASPESDPLQVKLAVENERRTALAGLAADAAVADAVDDAKVQAAYDAEVAAFKPAPEFNAAHILVDSEDKAKALKAEIDGGKDFAEVAKANSSDGSAANGGDLGWFGDGPDGAGVRDGGGGARGRARCRRR